VDDVLSTYAQHILNTGHAYGNIQATTEIIQPGNAVMKNIEKHHIFVDKKRTNK
jgi:hypothetical protein